MPRVFLAALVMTLLTLAGSALAMDQPTITMPSAGDSLGPNYDVRGSMPYKCVLVVITDCVRTDTGAVIGSVPGIRHWTTSTGQIAVRCASPRVAVGPDVPLVYRVRCFEVDRSGATGPETVIECRRAQ